VEVPDDVEEARRGQRPHDQAVRDLVLDLAALGRAELRHAACRLALVLEPAALQEQQLRWHQALVVAEAEYEVVMEEEIRRRERGEQRVVDRDPAPRLLRVAELGIALAERALRDGVRDRATFHLRRRGGDEADDARAGGEESHGGVRGTPSARRTQLSTVEFFARPNHPPSNARSQ